MIFKETYKPDVQDCNFSQKVTNKFILRCLENIAGAQSDYVGLGISNLLAMGKTWILLDWQVKIIERPNYNDILDVHTWSRKINKFYSYRDYEIYVNNKLCGIAASKWLVFDINKKKISQIDSKLFERYETETDKSVFEAPEPTKIKPLKDYDSGIPFTIRKTDIDINGHMHNLNYIDIAYEAFDRDKFINEPDNIRITYKKDIKYGDNISCLFSKADDKYFFSVVDSGTDTTHALIEMF